MPLGFEGIATETPEERSWPVHLDRPVAFETLVRWRRPAELDWVGLPEPVSIEVPGYLEYTREVSAGADGEVVVRRYFALLARRVPLADYGAFRDGLERVRVAEAARLVLGEEGR